MIWGGKVRYLFYTYIVLIKRNIAWLHYIPTTCLFAFAASPLIIYVWLCGLGNAPDNTDSQPGDNI